ncbi:PAS domain S-box protein [Synechococcus sp. CS-1328]|uniref:PAS domain S-box protein n=1 Tax=Synechococcus sp. CS-1328 TaxID=2847976 RepID=UPI00223BCC00|nr:PAS domain S-box protein [Synechococcus sp. CS-1328]MCT0226565.1 PAS domain S-box protein [Synechococcus sp. CS-1328]
MTIVNADQRPSPGRLANLPISIVAASLMVVLFGGIAWKQSNNSENSINLIAHSERVVEALHEADIGVLQTESAARGYIITGLPSFLIERRLGEQRLTTALNRIQDLIADNQTQRQRLKRLQAALKERLALLEDGVRQRSRVGFEPASQLVATRAQGSMQRVNTILTSMQHDEQRLLGERYAQLKLDQAYTTWFELLAALSLILLLSTYSSLFRQQKQTDQRRADEIVQGERRFRYLFEHSAVAKTIRQSNDAMEVNLACCQMLGYSQQEFSGLNWADLTHPDDRQATLKAINALQMGNSDSVRLIKRFLHKDGSLVWGDQSLHLRRTTSGEPLDTISEIVDITKLKLEEEAHLAVLNYARSLIEASLDPMVTISPGGLIRDVNEAMAQATGQAREALVGQEFAALFSDQARAREGCRQVFEHGSLQDFDLRLRHISGRLIDVEENASVYRDDAGVVAGVVAAARDVTEHLRLEHELQALNLDLEGRVIARTAELKRSEQEVRSLNAELEQRVQERTAELHIANEELGAFAYSVSHDLRAPLRAVDGFSRKLLLNYGQSLDDEGHRLLQVVRDNAVRMGQLIDDLLAFSRMGRRELQAQDVDMEAMARAVGDELCSLEPGRDIAFTCSPLPSTRGDAAMLREVWVNLLGNAIKFTGKQPLAHISVSGEVKGEEAIYTIRDDGAGFDMAYADKLFGVFQRLHRQDEFEGSGAGLAIAQRILRRHGGRIWGEGQPNQGATFSFALPNRGDVPSASPTP